MRVAKSLTLLLKYIYQEKNTKLIFHTSSLGTLFKEHETNLRVGMQNEISLVRENIEKQLMEIEILKSIYSNENEFSIEDQEALLDSESFLNGVSNDMSLLKRKLGYVLKFQVNTKDHEQLSLEIICRLPTQYPLESTPDVFVRCLNHNLDKSFTEQLAAYMISSHNGECSILDIVEWIKENIDAYVNERNKNNGSPTSRTREKKFTRTFIWSHHIYSNKKRQCIVNWAHELSLTGFCLPGKPGCICVEGDSENVALYVSRLKNLSWQKIQIKDSQTVPVNEDNKSGDLNKFDSFEEKLFLAGGESTIDLGLFFAFLKDKGLENIFALYFGVDGKLPASSSP